MSLTCAVAIMFTELFDADATDYVTKIRGYIVLVRAHDDGDGCEVSRISNSSTSKINVAFGGMPDLPLAPYASAGGTISLRLPPTCIVANPSSQPGITWPVPSLNSNGVRPGFSELSNRVPSDCNQPE